MTFVLSKDLKPESYPEISNLYFTRIEYDATWERLDKIQNAAFDYAHKWNEGDVWVKTTGSGPCWSAYIEIQGASKKAVQDVRDKTLRYMKRFKSVEIYL